MMKLNKSTIGFSAFYAYILLFIMLSGNHCTAQETKENSITPIYVNQIGYLPADQKIALVSASTGISFELISQKLKKPILRSMLQTAEPGDAATGSDLWQADFSIITATGEYTLSIPGIGQSYPFQIQDNLYKELINKTMAVFYLHRSNAAIGQAYAGKWTREAIHSTDGLIYSATGKTEIPHNATGGWFDGSDYGKYTVSGIYSAGILLMLYEQFPHQFHDGTLLIPEKANGIPDILDEIRWELDFILRMQNQNGAIHHKLTSLDPPKPEIPNKNDPPRYVFPTSTAATAGACALFAKASRFYSVHDATYATQCKNSALAAWKYLETHPSDNGFVNPADVRTKTFKDADDSDERFWAAIELYITTGEPVYQNTALSIENKRIPLISASGYWGNVMPLAVGSILKATPAMFDAKLRQTIDKDLLSLSNIISETVNKDGFKLSLKEGDFAWGSNGALLENALVLCLADINKPNKVYRQAAMDQLHSVLGRNPLSMCYITGFGKRSPKHPYHLISMADKVEESVPGLIVGGPNQFRGDSALKKVFTKTAAPATIYLDSAESYSSNETDLTWNAVLAFVASYISSK